MTSFLSRHSLREPARSSREFVQRLQTEMDDLITRFFGDRGMEGELTPPVDMSETDQQIEIRLDVPGIQPADIDVQLQGNQLTITGSRNEEKEEKGRTFHRIERSMGSFARTVTLPCAVQEEQIDARYQDGVLTITLPKPPQAQRRKIEIKSEGGPPLAQQGGEI